MNRPIAPGAGMIPLHQPTQSQRNRLLGLLAPEDFDRLRPHLQPITLDYKLPLYEAHQPIRFVYFPVSGVASLVNTMTDGSAAEVGTIGNEGMVGLPIVLGDVLAPLDVYMQVPGTGLRLEASVFAVALEHSAKMRRVMLHYAHAFFNQVAQSAACNHFHSIEQRCCRWMLMTHDRVQSETFILTQEFLGMMLGVRRSGVSAVARQLKLKKLIDYNRGHVTILNRDALEQLSCECYEINKREFDRLLGAPRDLPG
jgi:CRP-like cAMP-binding protein